MTTDEEREGLPASLQLVIQNTVAVMTDAAESKPEWQNAVAGLKEQAQALDRQPEAEFFQSVLDILEGGAASLPHGHRYMPALEAIREGIALADGGADPGQMEIVEALRQFMEAGEWEKARQVVETRQAELFGPQADRLLESFIHQAEAIGNQRAANVLEFHRKLLQECRADGIAAAFERLEQALEQMDAGEAEEDTADGIPSDFVERCTRALRSTGSSEQKGALFERVRRIAASNPDLAPLAQVVQLALLGDNPQSLGKNLPPEQRALWEQVLAGLKS